MRFRRILPAPARENPARPHQSGCGGNAHASTAQKWPRKALCKTAGAREVRLHHTRIEHTSRRQVTASEPRL
jgi:hypothetical protein